MEVQELDGETVLSDADLIPFVTMLTSMGAPHIRIDIDAHSIGAWKVRWANPQPTTTL